MRGKEDPLVLHAALGKTIVAMALTAVLIFSGFLLIVWEVKRGRGKIWE
jgi:hypothetical protein